jgi:hypothetical protein
MTQTTTNKEATMETKTQGKLGITRGKWEVVFHNWGNRGIYAGEKRIAGLSIESTATEENQDELEKEMNANAHLIAEAGTVANETGLTPRELKEQRDNLYWACKKVFSELNKYRAGKGQSEKIIDATYLLEKAIKTAEGRE